MDAGTYRSPLGERYASRAVELLAGAPAKDASGASALLQRLKRDSDFNSLRSREDFRTLLLRLEERGTLEPE